MPSATVSIVASASSATTAASIRSVACGPTMTTPSELAVRRLVDRLHPAGGLAGHHRACVRDPREAADGDVLGAVLLARLRLGEADARDLGIRVDRPRHGRSSRIAASCPVAFSAAISPSRNAGVRELPVAGDVARRVDVRHRRAAVGVGPDARARVERDARCLEPDPVDERRAADGDEHEVALDRLALAEVDGQRRAVSSTFVHCLPRWTTIPRRANDLRSSLVASASSCGMSVSSISTIVTSVPKRSKIDANSQPMIPPPRTTSRLGTSVCASRPVESTQRGESRPGIGGASGTSRSRRSRSRS